MDMFKKITESMNSSVSDGELATCQTWAKRAQLAELHRRLERDHQCGMELPVAMAAAAEATEAELTKSGDATTTAGDPASGESLVLSRCPDSVCITLAYNMNTALCILWLAFCCMHAVRADVLQAVADIAADSDKMANAAENAVPLKDDSAADADSATDVAVDTTLPATPKLEGAESPTDVRDVAAIEQPRKLAGNPTKVLQVQVQICSEEGRWHQLCTGGGQFCYCYHRRVTFLLLVIIVNSLHTPQAQVPPRNRDYYLLLLQPVAFTAAATAAASLVVDAALSCAHAWDRCLCCSTEVVVDAMKAASIGSAKEEGTTATATVATADTGESHFR
eukprot:14802-Heterococcus_DN1.PRE.4